MVATHWNAMPEEYLFPKYNCTSRLSWEDYGRSAR